MLNPASGATPARALVVAAGAGGSGRGRVRPPAPLRQRGAALGLATASEPRRRAKVGDLPFSRPLVGSLASHYKFRIQNPPCSTSAMRRALSFGRRPKKAEPPPSEPTATTGAVIRRALSFGGGGHSKLPRDWKRGVDQSDGLPYYFNPVTGERSRKRPQPLPRGWRAAKDPATGDIYFWCARVSATTMSSPRVKLRAHAPPPPSAPRSKKTREVMWERPDEAVAAPAGVGAGEAPTQPAADLAVLGASPGKAEGAPPAPASAKGGSGSGAAGPSSTRRVMSFGRRPRKAGGAEAREGAAPAAGATTAQAGYLSICLSILLYLSIYLYVCMFMCMHACMHSCIHVYVYVCVCVRVCVCMCVCVCVCVCMCV